MWKILGVYKWVIMKKSVGEINIERVVDGLFLSLFLVFIGYVRITTGSPYLYGYDLLMAGILLVNHVSAFVTNRQGLEDEDISLKVLLFIVVVTTGIDLIKYHNFPYFLHLHLYTLFSVKYITNRKLAPFHWIFCLVIVGSVLISHLDDLFKLYYIMHLIVLRVGIAVVDRYVQRVEKELYNRYLEQFMLIENAREAFSIYRLIKDKDDQILDVEILNVNRAFENLSGISKDEIIGKQVKLAFPDTEIPWLDLLIKVYNSKKAYNELIFHSKKQKYIDLNIYYIDHNHVALLMSDDTDRVRKEKEMSSILDRFEKANELKGQFLKDVNHRLRNPLNGMMGMMQLVDFEHVGEDNKELLDSALMEMRHVRNILNQITKYVEIQGMDFEFTREDCMDVLNGVIGSINNDTIKIDLIQVSTCPHKYVYIEKNILMMTFKETLLNAMKYTRNNLVEVKVDCYFSSANETYFLRLDVVDYGVGIGEDALKYIFNEFYHHDFVNVYREDDRITIPMCKQLLMNSGGDLLVESVVGQGTTFSILLPIYKD